MVWWEERWRHTEIWGHQERVLEVESGWTFAHLAGKWAAKGRKHKGIRVWEALEVPHAEAKHCSKSSKMKQLETQMGARHVCHTRLSLQGHRGCWAGPGSPRKGDLGAKQGGAEGWGGELRGQQQWEPAARDESVYEADQEETGRPDDQEDPGKSRFPVTEKSRSACDLGARTVQRGTGRQVS